MKTSNQNDYAKKFSSAFILKPKKTALLIIDLQYASASRNKGLGNLLKQEGNETTGEWRFNRIENLIIPNVKRLLKYFRKNELQVIYITLGSEKEDFSDIPKHALPLIKATNNREGSETHEILEEIKPIDKEIVINKKSFCAFATSNINQVLRDLEIEYVLCCGVSTNTCIESTARSAADYGYRTLIIEDASGAAAEKYHKASLENYARLFGRVSLTEDILNELKQNI